MKPLHGPNSGGNGLSAAENGAARTSDRTAAHIGFAVDVVGSGPRVVLVHGSVMNARATWRQQLPLADSFTLVLPNRSGYPPNPPLEYIDFYEQAAEIAGLLDDGSHLVGFSYGGVVALLAAAERAESLRSLTLVEPPALGLARGRAEADSLVLDLAKLVWTGPEEPRAFLLEFMNLFGAKMPLPATLSPKLEQGVRALMVERPPWDARFRLDELARAPFPKLVVSGAHSRALDAACDVLEERLDAERAVIPAGSHNIPQTGGPFNEILRPFLLRAEDRAAQPIAASEMKPLVKCEGARG